VPLYGSFLSIGLIARCLIVVHNHIFSKQTENLPPIGGRFTIGFINLEFAGNGS
jgi:hypothetical protein